MTEEVSNGLHVHTKLDLVDWLAEVGDASMRLTHRTRSGNGKESITFLQADFGLLYNLILSLAQLHPEWLNTQ